MQALAIPELGVLAAGGYGAGDGLRAWHVVSRRIQSAPGSFKSHVIVLVLIVLVVDLGVVLVLVLLILLVLLVLVLVLLLVVLVVVVLLLVLVVLVLVLVLLVVVVVVAVWHLQFYGPPPATQVLAVETSITAISCFFS